MNDQLKLFPFLIRDRKWKNGNLIVMMEAFLKGQDITEYFDFDPKYLASIRKEMEEFYKEKL